ncbi:MAG: peptidylprolyl isomerase [Clostridiales bacterium]|jgi:hypothetical protein|nr:peptidylprolyl isomerase [Clostridiales bacterium]
MKKKRKQRESAVKASEAEAAPARAVPKKRPLIVAITAVVLALALIAGAIVVIVVVLNDRFVDAYEDPTATVKLSNGMELNFTIWEEDCPNAATNFIQLAESKYFDGAILFDASKNEGFVRFGGYLPDGMHRGDEDTAYLDTIERMSPDGKTDYQKNKFGYRINKDSGSRASNYSAIGRLSFSYRYTATEFQITAADSTSLTVDGKWEISCFGAAADDKTIENILAIFALSLDDGTQFPHKFFRAPLDKDGLITIQSVKVKRLLKEKWKDFDFMTYYVKEDNSKQNGMGNWSSTTQKKTGNT